MLSQNQNRVQAIKSKFESLSDTLAVKNSSLRQLCKQNETENIHTGKENENENHSRSKTSDIYVEKSPSANSSYLYGRNEIKRSISDPKKVLVRQSSDPGKKLHRSHAFRCDRSQKVVSPKRHGSCNGRSETIDFSLKMGERKLSKDRLKRLGNLLEDQMRKENFLLKENEAHKSVPDSEVPKHILDQYAKVVKPKRLEKQDAMDSGVSSETENLEDEKTGRIKKLLNQFEKNCSEEKSNLESMNDIFVSSETMKLERKNPHLTLTDTLKKALKQPLPTGPPPKKPPRSFVAPITESPPKKDTKKMLEKLEQALLKKEALNETLQKKKPTEMHYLCTEILDITNRTLLSNQDTSCFKSLNCAVVSNNSTLSLPYCRQSVLNPNNFCTCSNETLNRRLSTFQDRRCSKCITNQHTEGFKCHINCKCKEAQSKFYIDKEPIYDEPYIGDECDLAMRKKEKYGTLNHSKSLEDLRTLHDEDQKIYDIPCEVSRPSTPTDAPSPKTEENFPKTDFEKLRQNFEKPAKKTKFAVDRKSTGDLPQIELTTEIKRFATVKPPMKPKPILKSDNTSDFGTRAGKIGTESKRYKKANRDASKLSFLKKDSQLELDRENLNRLMSEIYETVTEACNMDHKPSSFPAPGQEGGEDSVKLTRSLTEKRKNYVRRVSSKVAYLETNAVAKRFRNQTSVCSYKSETEDNPYSTFRSWKNFRTSHTNIAKSSKMADSTDPNDMTDSKSFDSSNVDIDSISIDRKTGCVDFELPFKVRDRGLFNVCVLAGLNYMTGQAYVKSVFPSQVQVPPHVENLIFPSTLTPSAGDEWSSFTAAAAQCYSLVLTDERGERTYGYCRRVLPEGATTCLPLCYCIISKFRAPGFYYKVLQELESHHGSSEVAIHSILQQLFDTDFPDPGQEITISYADKQTDRLSVCFSDIKCKTMPARTSDVNNDDKFVFCDLENNNSFKKVVLNVDGTSTKTASIKRPIEPRVDEHSLSTLLDTLGAGLTVKVFSSLLLQRKVVVVGDRLSQVSLCLEGLQWALYPLAWQQPLIATVPDEAREELLEAPLPILAGMIRPRGFDAQLVQFEEGMLIDITQPSKVLFCQGDESSILPANLYKTLKTSLQMETKKQDDIKTRNVMISEAFLRFFVDILGDFWNYLAVGELKEGFLGKGDVVFDRDGFIKNTTSKQNQYFLEWFTETAMFNHFIQNMATTYHNEHIQGEKPEEIPLVDTPLPNYYELFNARIQCKKNSEIQKIGEGKVNYKNAVNRKVKLLRTKLKDLVA